MSRWNYHNYTPSTPLTVKGGIKARSRRGAFGNNWWSKRWFEVLESYGLGSRLNRGKSYARRGQVLSIEVSRGLVSASVQGSRRLPYEVYINIKPADRTATKKIAGLFSSQPLFLSRLLAGEMPEEIEELFTQAGVPLYPLEYKDLATDCSCPDSSNPCKHIAAVFYILGEEFDRDPWLLFKLRGIDRRELLADLTGTARDNRVGISEPNKESKENRHFQENRLNREEAKTALTGKKSRRHEATGGGGDHSLLTRPDHTAGQVPSSVARTVREAETLLLDPALFWKGKGTPALDLPPLREGRTNSAALLQQLGEFPLWQGEKPFLASLEPIYTQATAAVDRLFRKAAEDITEGKGKPQR